MNAILLIAATRFALLAACALSPWLIARLVLRRRGDWLLTGAVAGATAVALNVATPLALHLAQIPIRPLTLATPHLALVTILLVLRLLTRTPWRPTIAAPRAFIGLLAAFAILVIPCTHLAGIDTYKWQGLATAVRVEESIPWLIHPVSLLGFTPRAYPSAQPLLLATIQLLGGCGVGAGFFILSLMTGATALCTATVLGRRVFDVAPNAAWFAALYLFSPVFMRYAHWATGRGLFLALYPLFILALLRLPRPAALLLAPASALLLLLAHKVGVVAIAILPIAWLASLLLPPLPWRVVPLLLALPFVAIAVLFSPNLILPPPLGLALGFIRTAITRFGWMLPVAAIGLIGPRGWLRHPARRRLLPAMCGTLPLAFPRDMYGAMLALPFIAIAATFGLAWLRNQFPRHARLLAIAAALLTAAGAITIVTNRNLTATPPAVYRAARFLESYDPLGPYQVFAPGRARVQIHAYVSGCPRFRVATSDSPSLHLRDAPPLLGPPAEVAVAWIDFGRNLIELSDTATDWYGVNPRAYYILINGEGEPPPTPATLLYDHDSITIHKPTAQPAVPP